MSFIVLLLIPFFNFSDAQEQRVNLEDVKIQGEGMQRGNFSGMRDKTDLDKNLKIPRNFRKEMSRDLPRAIIKKNRPSKTQKAM
jgi:hypothetical protein